MTNQVAIRRLRNSAQSAVPVVVIEAEGGAYHCFRSSAPVRVIVLDQDVEGSDQEDVRKVNGQMVNLIDHTLDQLADDGRDGVALGYVADLLDQVDAGLRSSDSPVPTEIRQPTRDEWVLCLRFAVERVRIANAEGNPILSAWLPDAEALLRAPTTVGSPEVLPEAQRHADAAGARRFFEELLDSVETLSGIADQYGSRTLADLMYLQNAIANDSGIDHYVGESAVMEVVKQLPSAERWLTYVDCQN